MKVALAPNNIFQALPPVVLNSNSPLGTLARCAIFPEVCGFQLCGAINVPFSFHLLYMCIQDASA